MSRCGRTHLLEQLVAGELSGQDDELRSHALHCSRCRHELNWLESERSLFRQRAGRDEVQHLWQGVAQRSGLEPVRWSRVLVAVAASLLVVLGVGRGVLYGSSVSGRDASVATESLQSLFEEEDQSFAVTAPSAPCSQLPEGLGFHCGYAIPASFLASR